MRLCRCSVGLATIWSHWPTCRPLNPPRETGTTFADNARLKARYYATRTGLLTVAEDSGLEVDAIGGRPGVESARYGGDALGYPDKFRLLYAELRAADWDDREHGPVCLRTHARKR